MKAAIMFELGPLKEFLKTPYLYRRLAFSADGRYLALTGRQESEAAFVWDVSNKNGVAMRPPITGAAFLKFVGKSNILMGSQAKMWDIAANAAPNPPAIVPADEKFPDGKTLRPYFDFCMDVDPTGRYLLGAPVYDDAYFYSQIGLWELPGGQLIRRFDTPKVKYNAARVRFSSDSQWFTYVARLGQDDEALHLSTWEVSTGKLLMPQAQTLQVGMDDFDFQISQDGQMLAVANNFYSLDQNGATPAATFQQDTNRTSRRLLSAEEIMEVSPEGQLTVFDKAGRKLAELELEYTTFAKGQALPQKLEPRSISSSPSYYAAADDNAVLLWTRGG